MMAAETRFEKNGEQVSSESAGAATSNEQERKRPCSGGSSRDGDSFFAADVTRPDPVKLTKMMDADSCSRAQAAAFLKQ